MISAGFDTDIFPGLEQMAWLRTHTNLSWCGYYLAPAPSHQNTSWMGNRAALAAQGWRIAPIYVGQQVSGPGSKILSDGRGMVDGAEAASLMAGEGFPNDACIYLDLENGAPLTNDQADYVASWAWAVDYAGFRPGVYCSHGIAAAVSDLCPDARIWAFKVPTVDPTTTHGLVYPTPDPAGSGFSTAVAWQRVQNTRLLLPGAPLPTMVVDLSTATDV